MPKIYFLPAVALVFTLLSGCLMMPLPGIGWATVPLGPGLSDLELPGYSLGPISSEQFPDLLEKAIPPGEGAVHLSGRVELVVRLDNYSHIISAVAALSDTDILLLKWHDLEGRYELLARLPYSDILSLSTNSVGLGRVIYLCLATSEFTWKDQSHAIEQRASMSFVKPSGMFGDVERTEAALYLLQERVEPVDGACQAPAEAADGALQATSH